MKLAVAALLAATLAMLSACKEKTINESDISTYGERLVATYQVPAEIVENINKTVKVRGGDGKWVDRDPNPSGNDTWEGPTAMRSQADNPYHIVLTVRGTAISSDDVSALFYAGWQLADKGDQQGNPMGPAMAKEGVQAGEAVVFRAEGKPMHFTADANAFPTIGIWRLQNLKITSISVQIVTGAGKTTIPQLAWAGYTLMVGLIMFVLWWFWLRRKPEESW